ncbi:hypothetical protein Tco_0976634 [Tanacetum coccineum]|uniref:MAK10-like protein n=1 Tax=Tanacetum coccineum TaxID=301880 RepID=A0ABQ5EI29_9ASTR
MENANPPPTNNRHVLQAVLRAQAVQELHELQLISAFVDSHLESIERFLNNFANQPNETNMNDLESDDESVDTPLVSPFSHSDNDSNGGEVLNELIEYENVGMLRQEKAINSFDGDDLAFQCMIGFRKFVAYFNPFLPMNIITRNAYNTIKVEGLESTRRNLVAVVRDVYVFVDSKGGIPSKIVADAKIAIQEMAEYSQIWHNGTSSRTRSTETSNRCELCKGPHYTKDCPQKEEGKTLEEAYYTQFGAPYQPGGQYRAVGLGFYQRNNGYSSYQDRRPSLEESLTKFMAESAKRHEENSNIIKEIRDSTDAAIRNQGASIKTLEIQIGQMSKVLQERIWKLAQLYKNKPSRLSTQHRSILSKTVPFPNRLQNFNCDDWREAQDVKIMDAYDHTLPLKEKDPWSFTLPYFIHNICFDKALVDLEASFTIIDDDDMTKDVVLGMKFCKKYASCQMIMRKFEQYGDLAETMIWYMLKKTCVELIRAF